jgi:hypothetical protein
MQAKANDANSHLNGFGHALLSAQPPAAGFTAARATLRSVGGDVKAIRMRIKDLRNAAGSVSARKS